MIREYARNDAEASFGELVHRHIDLVYSTAFRVLRNAELADEVSQRVFVALARNAKKLEDRAVLAGWLHQTARHFALETVRSEERRRQREKEAADIRSLDSNETQSDWDQIAPWRNWIRTIGTPSYCATSNARRQRKSARSLG